MRFRFCGDLDCPDWVVAEIALLSRLTSIKLKLCCEQIIQQHVKRSMEFEKIQKFMMPLFDLPESRRCIATLLFIYKSAAKNGCSSQALNAELQQLGLPHEHCQQVCKVFEDNLPSLTNEAEIQFYKVDDGILKNANLVSDANSKFIGIVTTQKTHNGESNFTIRKDKAALLLNELEAALRIMKDYEI